MPDQTNSETPQAVISALLASGFPFQTAVARVVGQALYYTLAGEEVPWRDDTGTDQFLDLVAQRGLVSLPIECKKTQKDILTFLRPSHADGDVNRARCMYLSQIQDSTSRMEMFCGDWYLMPKSAESTFCVVSTSDSGKDQRMLERDIQQLVRGSDAYVRSRKLKVRTTARQPDLLFIPLLVTNAKMFVADYDPVDVSLDTGQFSIPPRANISSVTWVRFRKAFSSAGKDIGDRTVFVVAAPALSDFLKRLDIIGTAPSEEGKIQVQ
jgi:hypothetical protein